MMRNFAFLKAGAALLAVFSAFFLLSVPADAGSKWHYQGVYGGVHIGSGIVVGTGKGVIYYDTRRYDYGRPGYAPPRYYPPRYYPRRVYRPYRPKYYPGVPYILPAPVPRHAAPAGIPIAKNGLVPFTPEWIAYCSRKFKSFDPRSGTYLAYSGKRRYCR
ncbi:hypothetical protein GCM10011316_22260 [Roseibium aquae]|uniref:Lectin-like protein BA14k n=1 Tax=Roseibium aquae TaxID=1323746 RepID=A0A916TKG3_9HYPH|nr:BA14K family protein [Roseibium aquae]GGB49699.1 hypothetical protein GCM10011316_22260 [Roseibium aquae]